MKKTLLALALLLALLPLSGCSDWEDSEPDDVFQTLKEYYNTEEPDREPTPLTSFSLPYFEGETVDPISCSEGPHQVLGSLLYEGLFTLDPHWEVQPLLAERYTYDAASHSYTIELRSDVTFSDGSPLNAYDVVSTLQRARSSPRYASRLQDVSSIYSYGNTVEINLRRDNAQLPALLDIPIIKAGTEDSLFPIGTGPYSYTDQDGKPRLVANTAWHIGKPLPLQEIGLVRCKDNDSVAYAFYAREVQLLSYDLTATHGSNVSGIGIYEDAPSTAMHYIGLNVNHEPLNNPAVRHALSLGIDRGECVNAYLLGHGLPAQYPLSPASTLYPAGQDVAYSPDNFDSAMAAAGYSSGNTTSLTMIVNAESEFKVSAAQKIAADLSRHDLKISVEALPWDSYLQRLRSGNFDLYYGECRMTADWDLQSLLGAGGALNYGGYADPKMDTLMQAALSSDEQQRSAAYNSLYTYFEQQSPLLPVCFKSLSVLMPSGAVEKITPTAANPFYDFSQWKLNMK